MVFFPSKRELGSALMAAANSEAGTTSSPAVIAVRDPSWNCFTPFEKLVGVDVVQASDMRDGHTGLKGLPMAIFLAESGVDGAQPWLRPSSRCD